MGVIDATGNKDRNLSPKCHAKNGRDSEQKSQSVSRGFSEVREEQVATHL